MGKPDHVLRRRRFDAGRLGGVLKALALLLGVVVAAQAQTAAPRLTEAAIRAFVARQEAAWNAGDVRAWASTYAPDATLADQARNSQGGLTANGSSTLAQATAQARRFFARSRIHETSVIESVAIAPDGRSAEIVNREVARIDTPGRPPRTLCAQSAQTVVLVRGRILTRRQVDTDIRCRH